MVLAAHGLQRRAADERWLLRDVSLAVGPGERIAVVGPSGSGKSLLLRALALLDPVDAGEVHWNGVPVAPHRVPDFRAVVTYVPQRAVLLEGTVEENLRRPYAFRVHHQARFDREWILTQLRQLGRASAFLNQRHTELSGGEAQLVALLRTLQLNPTLLLLDEPTASLDRHTTEMAEALLGTWLAGSTQRACIWVTHDLAQANRVAGGQFVMDAGSLQPRRPSPSAERSPAPSPPNEFQERDHG